MKEWINQLPQKHLLSLIDHLMIMLGIIGLVGGMGYSLYFPDQFLITLLALTVLGWVIYHFQIQGKPRQSLQIIGFLLLICLLYFLLFSDEIQSLLGQLKTIIEFDYFLRFDELFKNTQTTHSLLPSLFLMILGIPLVYLIVSLMTKKKRNLFKICICILVFLFPLFINHSLHHYTSYCFLIFIVYQFIFSYTLKFQSHQLVLKIIIIVGLSLFSVFSNIFLEPNPIFKQNSSTVLANITNWIDNSFFQDFFGSQNKTGVSSSVSGRLPDDDITFNTAKALEVEADYPFTSYLRGYSFARYEENRWKPVLENYEGSQSVTYYSDYIRRNYPGINQQFVKITSLKSVSYQFVPYFSILDRELVADSYYLNSDEKIRVLMAGQAFSDEESYHFDKIIRGDYEEFVKQEYLDVPESLRSQLVSFIETKNTYGLSLRDISEYYSPQELAAEIRRLLGAETQYDLNCGKLPDGQDFVDYFLFQNKKGSCTHYATTGTLLLRCLGIPARYVNGFVMKADDFQDGVASIGNNRSHAWVEIYLEGAGWIPCEMTPTGNNSGSLADLGTMLDDLAETETPPTIENPTTNQPATQTPDEETPVQDEPLENIEEETTPWYAIVLENSQYIIRSIVIICLLLIYRFISSKAFFIKLKHKSHNQKGILYYQRMQRILRFGGEIDKNIQELALKAKFSQHALSDEELLIMKEYYAQFIRSVYQSLPFYKKIIYKFIFGYC